jgi:ABC-type multidrug transport system ATPase subunit
MSQSPDNQLPLVAAAAAMDLEAASKVVLEQNASVADTDEVKRGGIDLQWNDLQCFVAEAKEQGRIAKRLGLPEVEGPPSKQIIKSASGFARAGEVLAVMGPSGSGKTTLLNVLAQRPTLGKKGYWRGDILLNGAQPWKDWERDMAYVMQKDIFYDELKVDENLLTTALLRLPTDWSQGDKIAYLDKMIEELGLQDVRKTKIGTAVDRGLSGGEVKRASIANESLALPRIFLLDEPLTGLDSSRAVDVMQNLQKLAHEEGTTVMLTIHQPSSALYSCFDRLLMLGTGGRTAFFGDVSDAVPHFSKIGHPLPPLWAPSDHFIQLLSVEESRELVCEAWTVAKQPLPPPPRPRPPNLAPMPAFTAQVKVLLPRSYKRICRSYLKRLNWKLHFALSILWGLIYYGVGRDAHDRLTDLVGAIFFLVAHWSWTPLFQGLGNFPKEKEMLTKERASKVYEIRSFFTAQVIAEAPVLLVFPLLFFAVVWPMAALPGQTVVQTFAMVALNIQVCSSMSMLISAACMDSDAAVSVAIVVMCFEMCTGGYFADMRQLPACIGWVRYTSSYYYVFGAILRLMVAVPFGDELHQKAISKYSFSDLGYFMEVAMLTLMLCAMRLATYLQLRFTKKLSFS